MKTLRIRIKDKHAKLLTQLASEVNFVWNYINELSYKNIRNKGLFLSAYDIQKYTAGATKEGLGINSKTIDAIADEYATRRRQFKKIKLRWRVSNPKSPKRSLGWIPFKKGTVVYKDGQLRYAGRFFSIWDSYGLSKYDLRAGSFSQDARGRWYANICVETPENEAKPVCRGRKAIGIDLGLKDFATLSDGTKIEAQRLYRAAEAKLAIAQRAGNKKRVRAIHAKISNTRKDFLHKLSTQLVRDHAAIFVGNVNAGGLAKTKLAKSVLDAGWSAFRTMLQYKSDDAGVWFEEVNEAYTTQVCSCCGAIPASSPKGRAGLRIREWECVDCGTIHDRDINSALNILALGHQRLVEETCA